MADCIVAELRDEYERTPVRHRTDAHTCATTAASSCAHPLLLCAVQLLQLLFLGLHTPAADRPHAKAAEGDALSLAELNGLLCLSRQSQSVDAYIPLYSPFTLHPSSSALVDQRIALTWQLLSLPYCRLHSDMDLRRMTTRQPS